jgi:hypothetical protein
MLEISYVDCDSSSRGRRLRKSDMGAAFLKLLKFENTLRSQMDAKPAWFLVSHLLSHPLSSQMRPPAPGTPSASGSAVSMLCRSAVISSFLQLSLIPPSPYMYNLPFHLRLPRPCISPLHLRTYSTKGKHTKQYFLPRRLTQKSLIYWTLPNGNGLGSPWSETNIEHLPSPPCLSFSTSFENICWDGRNQVLACLTAVHCFPRNFRCTES